MHDTCSDENDMLRFVCKKSDTVTEPLAPTAPPAALDTELSLSASIQLPGDKLKLPAQLPTMSLGDRYDIGGDYGD